MHPDLSIVESNDDGLHAIPQPSAMNGKPGPGQEYVGNIEFEVLDSS
jgi:hypothetical protein